MRSSGLLPVALLLSASVSSAQAQPHAPLMQLPPAPSAAVILAQSKNAGRLVTPGASGAGAAEIDFGDDASIYANDGECDDPRFEGPGMTTTPLLDTDRGHDASDCRAAYQAGTIRLKTAEGGTVTAGGDVDVGGNVMISGIDFGTDTSPYANDGECDDPRFEGPGMAAPPQLESDLKADATDCSQAFLRGEVRLRSDAGGGAGEPEPGGGTLPSRPANPRSGTHRL